MMGTFSLLLAGIVGLAFIARRLLPLLGQRYQPRSSLKHLGTLALTPQCSVALVEAGQETLVLGLTPHHVTLLAKAGQAPHPVGGEEARGARKILVDPSEPDLHPEFSLTRQGNGK
jgi:flagellar biogenesis protein FliO